MTDALNRRVKELREALVEAEGALMRHQGDERVDAALQRAWAALNKPDEYSQVSE